MTYAWAGDTTSEYMIGGEKFIPDTEYFYKLCQDPHFKCRKVKRSDTWRGLFPNDKERELMMRLNRTNVPLQYRNEILLPKNIAQLNYQHLSPFPQQRDTHGKRVLYIDLDKFAFAAYDKEGRQILWGPASGGKPWCEDTKSSCLTAKGDFHVYRIKGEECQSGTYPLDTKGGAEMPYCMYYYKGFAIHGSTLSGFINRSRGCIRLFESDAKWLNQQFVQLGTEVIVKQ
jgi:L,D-transpeptidase ErfK/SrfK